MQLEYEQPIDLSVAHEDGVASGGWSHTYPQWRDSGTFADASGIEEEDEKFYFEDTSHAQSWSDANSDSVPILASQSGRPGESVDNPLMPYTIAGGLAYGGGCSSMLAQHHIRGFTQTEESSVLIGAGVVHSFSVVTISVSSSSGGGPDPYSLLADDNFSDDFELTVMDEQATMIRKRSPVQSVPGCIIAVVIAAGAMLLVGVMLWATYAAAGAIVNFMFIQHDSDAHRCCLVDHRDTVPELHFKSESVTAPLLKA